MTRRRLASLAALLLAACPAPAPTDDAGVDAGVTVTPVELCERLAAARCELELRCYPAFTRADHAACVTQENSACLAEYETLRPSFEAGTVSIDPDRLASCERRMKTSACPPSFPPDYPVASVARPFADCTLQSGLLVGRIAAGATCERAVECAPGTVCIKPDGVCRGTCSSWPAAGEPCGFGCGPGLRCSPSDTCVPLATLNEPCTSSAECEPDLICLGSCRPRRKLNETCTFDPDRLSTCEPGLACDVVPFVSGLTGTCVRPRAPGEPCRFHWSCAAGLVCADIDWSDFPNKAPSEGNCREPDGAGFNCSRSPYLRYVGDQCAPGLSCRQDTGKCEALPRLGEACTPSLQNCGGVGVYCKPSGAGDVGTCTGPAGLNDRCAFQIDASRTVAIPCSAGYCDTETTLTCRAASRVEGQECTEDGQCLSNRCMPQPDMTLRCAPEC